MVAKYEIMAFIQERHFATREQIADHFQISPNISGGKKKYPGSLNNPISKLMKHGELIALDNGIYKIFMIPPAREI